MGLARILYLTPGCFDKGGISRYSRFQIRALREILGDDRVRAYSLMGAGDNDFEEPFRVDWKPRTAAHTFNKAHFSAIVSLNAIAWRPQIIWAAHVHLSPLACVLAAFTGAKVFLNAYGHEVWSGLTSPRRWGLMKADRIVTDCHFTKSYLLSHEQRGADGVDVIWDTVDVTQLFPAPPDPKVMQRYRIPDPARYVNVMTLGRLGKGAEHKGYDRLLRAFSLVAPRDERLMLLYAGSGSLVEKLQKQAHQLGVGERVFFLGSIREQDLADVYRSCHVFSLISDRGLGRGEGVPVTPLEASACGIPVMVGNQDGSPEAVIDGETGYVVDSMDIHAQAEAIMRLVRDPELRYRMGNAAYHRAVAEFSYPAFLQKHEQLLSSNWCKTT